MRNLLIGFLILAAGGWFLAQNGTIRVNGFFGKKPSGNISGYSAAPSGSLGATKSAAGRILK